MGRHTKYRAPKAKGANAMSYADHVKKAFKRGAMPKHEKPSDYFDRSGRLKQKASSPYEN